MPGTADKVKFGVKNVHYALLTNGGTPTYDTPVAIPGAVSLSLEANGESTPFYADNMQYYVTVSNSGYETELEVAIFPDSFLKDVLGYTQSTTDKVLTENSNVQPKPFALLFEEAGDQSGTKFVLYNCTATRPSRTLETTEDTTEPTTQTCVITASPLTDGRTMAMTSADSPETVGQGWYTKVWLADAPGA